jgi:cytidyltransferase-like protein
MNRLRIGIFPGAFDPFHKGHLWAAKRARDSLNLDMVLIQVSPHPRHKIASASDVEHRREMVRMTIADEPGLVLVDLESPHVQTNYAIDMIRTVRRIFPVEALYLLVGADEYKAIKNNKWKDAAIFERYIALWEIDRSVIDICATTIRECRRHNDNRVNDYLDSKVLQYIIDTGLYQ